MLMAWKLIFRGLLLILVGCAVVLPVILGSETDPKVQELLISSSIIDVMKARPQGAPVLSQSDMPLNKEANTFAQYLNPPPSVRKRPIHKQVKSPTISRRTAVPKKTVPQKPPQITAKFKVLATTCYPARPAESLALIWQPGGDLEWVKPGMRLGHFTVEQIKHGVLVYKDGDQCKEMAVLSQAEQKGPTTDHKNKLAAHIYHKIIKKHE